jgi:hypothetical protein
MIKFGIILVLLVSWLFATMTKVNDKANSTAAFIWKSIFYWVAVAVAYSLGAMH